MDSRQLRPQRMPQSQRSRSRSQPSTPSVPPAAWGRPDTESNPQEEMQTQDWDITQMVAELVSEDVDRDVLLPRPPRCAASTSAFQDFLARSPPFWQSSTFEAQTSRSPPS